MMIKRDYFKIIMLCILFLKSNSLHTSPTSTNKSSEIQRILSSIPSSDVKDLENFFRTLFSQSGFAYTLLGEKPIVCIDYNLSVLLQALPDSRLNSLSTAFKGHQVWQKHKHLFQLNQFDFICYTSNDFSCFGIVLLNKEKINTIFKKNAFLLSSAFGDEAHLAHFFQQPPLQNISKVSLQPQFHHAFGIILGYGNKNSEAFRKRNELINYLKAAPLNLNSLNDADLKSILQDKTWANKEIHSESTNFSHNEINSAIEALNFLRSNYRYILATQREPTLSPMELPGFLAFENDEETQAIKNSYDKIRPLIVETLYDENFLVKFLILLTE